MRLFQVSLLLTLSVVLAACSTLKLAYNNLDTLAYYWLSRGLDLSDEQEQQIKIGLRTTLVWHRRQELPRLMDELQYARTRLSSLRAGSEPVTAVELDNVRVALLQSLYRTLDHSMDATVAVVSTLTPAQWTQVQKRLDESNKDYQKKWLGKSQTELVALQTEHLTERFERWLGRLDVAQRSRISTWARNHAPDIQARYTHRLVWQKEFMALPAARTHTTPEQFAQSIRVLLGRFEQPSPSQRLEQARYWQSMNELTAELLGMATKKQLDHASERAADWTKQLVLLQGESN